MNPSDILKNINTLPKKWFGQNFLHNDAILDEIVAAGEIKDDETVVEIGPGLGALTERLLRVAGKVIAIEADRELADYLRGRRLPRFTLITGDALHIDWTIDIPGKYKIVANIPYSITSPLLRKIYHLEKKPERVVLLVQKEVAERLTAEAGDNSRGFLTLLTEANANVKILRHVKPGNFFPAPKVDSSVIILELKETREEQIFWPAVEAAFSHKRQTLVNGLKIMPISRNILNVILEDMKLSPMVRPAELTFEEWMVLSKRIKEQVE